MPIRASSTALMCFSFLRSSTDCPGRRMSLGPRGYQVRANPSKFDSFDVFKFVGSLAACHCEPVRPLARVWPMPSAFLFGEFA